MSYKGLNITDNVLNIKPRFERANTVVISQTCAASITPILLTLLTFVTTWFFIGLFAMSAVIRTRVASKKGSCFNLEIFMRSNKWKNTN